jgi:hypothetical protein
MSYGSRSLRRLLFSSLCLFLWFFLVFFSRLSRQIGPFKCSRLSLDVLVRFGSVVVMLLYCFCFTLLYFALLLLLLLALLVVSRTRTGYMSRCPSEIDPVLARHLILNHTYALSGTDISVLSIERHLGPNQPLWTFVFQFAYTEITARQGPFRSAMPSGL